MVMLFVRLVGVILVACMCLASSANAAQTSRLRVAFSPDRAGARTTVTLSLRIAGSPPIPVTSFDLRLPANMGIATSTLGEANCKPAALLASGLAGCPPDSRIGFGSATAVVPVESQSVLETATTEALMGEPAEDRLEVLFYLEASNPVFAQLVLPSVLEEASPPFGEQLATAIPLVEAWPEGPDMALETFDTTIGPKHLTYYRTVHGRTIAYKPRGLRLPEMCPRGGFPFGVELGFQNGARATAEYRVPCPRQRSSR
jgi:hypothetical protein